MKHVIHITPVLWMLVSATFASDGDGHSHGVGLALARDSDIVVIKAILPDSPAARSKSFTVGDIILEVGQGNEPAVALSGMGIDEIVGLIRGPAGTTLRITTAAPGKDRSRPRIVSLTRGEIGEISRWGNGELIKEGEIAPNVAWITIGDSSPGELLQESGKIQVIVFWASWCRPCKHIVSQLLAYQKNREDWDKEVIVIAASVDDNIDLAAEFAARMNWSGERFVWLDGVAIKTYGINTLPTIYIISPNGTVAASGHDLDTLKEIEKLIPNK